MRINSSYVGMDSERVYSSQSYSSRKLSASVSQGALGADYFGNLLDTNAENEAEDKEDLNTSVSESNPDVISDPAQKLRSKIREINSPKSTLQSEDPAAALKRLKEEYINLLLRLLFPELKDKFTDRCNECESQNLMQNQSSDFSSNMLRITTLTSKSEYYYEESESTSFTAQGIVNCADGSSISFDMNIEMSRSFSEYYEEEVDVLQASLTDPLVINFDGNVADVSDQTFYFDIDSDGIEDEISRLISGSGFLALDLNDDGVINDGSELFGTKSGNGFKDLAFYDTDNDGFIDEDDEIFNKLKIMTIDENGNQQLYSLKDKNIGAIGLMNAKTDFSLNSLTDNSTNAVIRSTGVFLYETGGVGSVQQVDFARKQMMAAYA